MAMPDAPRLRRRPRPARPLLADAMRRPACRIGFAAGFVVGVVVAAGLAPPAARRDLAAVGRADERESTQRPENSPPPVKAATAGP